MKFVKLTGLSDDPVYVAPSWVQTVRPASKGFKSGAKAELMLSGPFVAVKETPEEVVKLLEQA